ncbi:type VI secretion system contractile sheath small subunit [Serratia ureilytica]
MTFGKHGRLLPAAIARKVDALDNLLDARTQLSNLLSTWTARTAPKSRSPRSCKIRRCCNP